jgi:hypothetical protein
MRGVFIMTLRRGLSLLFKNSSRPLNRSLYTGISNTSFNPLLSLGGRLLLKDNPAKDIMTELKNNPNELKMHVESSIGLVGLTPKKWVAEKFSANSGFSANDSESYCLHKPTSTVGDVDVSNLDLIHMENFVSGKRTKQETESGTVIVMPHTIKCWYINICNIEYQIDNPFYLPDAKGNQLFEQLQADFIEILRLKADCEFNEDNPKAVEAVDKYIGIFIEIAGGSEEFNEKLKKLTGAILATGYEFYPPQASFLDRALDISARYQLLSP